MKSFFWKSKLHMIASNKLRCCSQFKNNTKCLLFFFSSLMYVLKRKHFNFCPQHKQTQNWSFVRETQLCKVLSVPATAALHKSLWVFMYAVEICNPKSDPSSETNISAFVLETNYSNGIKRMYPFTSAVRDIFTSLSGGVEQQSWMQPKFTMH